ncbi:Dynein heavy chain 1, axonemal [Nowakowskiella sp. JEL0078]|nr:Dynein heavy chain 1, axonemal [Nowakowskiella sp. JEL0078]
MLAELKKKMREAEINIKEMEKRYTESVAKKEELSRKVEECNLKLGRAGKLISGLGGEKQRWALTVDHLDIKINNIIGDILLASGAIAYLGPFTAEYRQSLLKDWTGHLLRLKIPHSENTTLFESLGDVVKLREWELHGLPKDSLSRDNAIIVQNSRRWPLLIDPQGQANKWIRNMEKETGLDIIKLTDRDFLRTLENAIRFGKPVMLENVAEKLDPALEPILLRQTFKQGGNTVIKVGDSILPYHEDFRFYITTKLPNPHYSPETSATVTLLNFTLAPSGLEDQLLAIVVANERPDLEEEKSQLVLNNAQMKKELKDIEDKILYLLSSVQGSPVDDERLIETLAASKETSEEIQVKVAAAEKTEKDIDIIRNKYAPVAIRTRILFFCITELANIDPMYQYSLGWFMNLFISAISHSEKSDDIDIRIVNINEYFTFSLFTNVCRSLFEKHKLLFAFLLTIRILMNDDKIDLDEWKFLLTGGNAIEKKIPNPASDWLSGRAWEEIQSLSSLPNFSSFEQDFCDFIDHFKTIFDSNQPHREPLPGRWQNHLNRFQKLLVLRGLRADRVTSAVQDFVAENLGERFIEPQTSDLSALYKESNPCSPLIFVLSPGADPASSLYKFAEEMRFSKKLTSVSLGQGQGPRAEALIKEGSERGIWVLLQNCHLSPSWMPTLDRIIDGFTPDKVHRDFRLWLTSMPTPKFPVTILQNGVKTTMEPPNGIKANLMRTYATFNDDFLNSCNKTREWKKLLFSLSFFHAIVQERRKFGALGWNIPYEFTDGDYRICVRQLKMFLEEYTEIPFKVLKYTVGEINYGGRVTDDWDRRLITTILEDFYSPKVIDDMHCFSSSDIYYSIPADNFGAYRNYIKGLPIDENTEIFSMHENANITFAQKETLALFDTLLTLMPKSSKSSGGKTREDILADTALSIQTKVPKPFNFEAVLNKYPVDYKESMSTVLLQEVIRYNRLLSEIHSTLTEMGKALKGLVVMSESLETMCNNIFINQVPIVWAAKAYPSLKTLSAWVIDLIARCTFIQTWIDTGIPVVYWISGFFFPQAFLTGTLQNFARKYVVSIDTLSFDFKVIDTRWEDIPTKPSDGCYIRGLYLEGSRWDAGRKVLAESRAKELYTEMEVLWLVPKANRKKPETGIYDCPVYKTLTRAGTLSTTGHSTNYVLTIELPSDLPQSHWIKRGVALITGMLVTGVINTILNKLQDMQCVEACDDPENKKYFEQPVWQTANMFIGETLCLLVYHSAVIINNYRNSKANGYIAIESQVDSTEQNSADSDSLSSTSDFRKDLKGTAPFLFWIPTLCDLTATTLMNIGLIYVSASVYQMLRGSVVLFTGTFSVWFLGRRHPLYRWFALVTVFVGVGIVGLSGFLSAGKEVKTNSVGIFLVVLAQIFTASQFVIEEKILARYSVAPLQAVGLEGLFGLISLIVGLPILYYSVGVNHPGGYFDVPVGWHQFIGFPQILYAGIGIIFSIAFFNWFGLSVTRVISATSRSTIDTSRTLFIWIVSLSLGWETFKWLQVLGFAVLIYGTFLFNDVISPPAFCRPSPGLIREEVQTSSDVNHDE